MSEKNSCLYKLSIVKKVNAVLSLLCTVLVIIHGLYDALWMASRGKMPMLSKPFTIALMVVVIIHIILSIISLIVNSKGKTKEEKTYVKDNIKTIIQRVTGILMLVLLVFHIIGMQNHLLPHMLHAIVHPVFFLVVYIHTMLSFSKSMITLGIGNAKGIKVMDIIMYIICILLFIVSVVGLYLVMFGSWQG